MKKLIKELILISGLKGLTSEDFVKRIIELAQAAKDNPEIAPDLDPETGVIFSKANAITTAIAKRTAELVIVKATTVEINAGKSELVDLMNNSWAPQAQKAVAGNFKDARTLAWYIKGIYTGEAPENAIVGNAANSYPSINKIDSSVHLQHTVFTRNSASGKAGLPKDAKSIEVYMQIGGLTPPVDIKSMSHLGSTTGGNFTNNFEAADIGKTVYYIVVYFDKKTKKALTLSPVMSAVVG